MAIDFRALTIALAITAVVGTALYIVGPMLPERPEKARAISETSAVTRCDDAARRVLLSPDSMDTHWDWQTYWTGFDDRYGIRRDFSAKNAFGVPLPFHYECQVDGTSGRVLDLKVVEGYRH